MDRKNWILMIVGYAMVGVLFWFFAKAAGGWVLMGKIMGIMIGGAVIMGACVIAIIALIYLLTIFQSNRYIKFLRMAGYDAPSANKQSARAFAALLIAGICLTAAALYIAVKVFGQNGPESIIPGIAMAGMWGTIGVGCLVGAIQMWRMSHKRLQQYCEEVRSGQIPKLPRFRA